MFKMNQRSLSRLSYPSRTLFLNKNRPSNIGLKTLMYYQHSYYSNGIKNNDQAQGSILEDIKAEAAKFTGKLHKYNEQFKVTIENAQKKIQEANAKIKAQETDAKNVMYDTDLSTHKTIDNLPSKLESRRNQFARKLEFYFDSLQETIFTATKALNDVTGYSAIQKLRNSINLMEKQLHEQKELLKQVRVEHEEIVAKKTFSQHEINSLLQRKSSWDPTDLEYFTKIYKQNQENTKLEEQKSVEVKETEKKTLNLENDLHNAILTRYHEEQVWSDKIRRTSTWGTFMLMGVNILLFVIVQIVFEPWKRRRLVRAFENKVNDTLEQFRLEQNEKMDKLLLLLENRELSPEDVNKNRWDTKDGIEKLQETLDSTIQEMAHDSQNLTSDKTEASPDLPLVSEQHEFELISERDAEQLSVSLATRIHEFYQNRFYVPQLISYLHGLISDVFNKFKALVTI